MLKLNVNEEKQLNFEIQIGGVQTDQVTSFLRIEIDQVEYGFPAQVGQDSITVDLPALRAVTARKLQEGEEVAVKLEIVADGHYLTPWSDTFTLSNPLVIEAKIMDADFKNAPAFKTKLVQTGNTGEQKQGVVVESEEEKTSLINATEDEMTERIVNKLAEKLSPMMKGKSDKVVTEDKAVEKAVKSSKTKTEGLTEEKAIAPVKKVDVKNITEEGVYQYMARAGTTNEKIQQLIYEQAEIAAGNSKPVEVLRQVVKLLKSKK
jgi:hypothetical protein